MHLILAEAVWLRASDIHIEPFRDRIRVRYRIDGVLVERDSPPRCLLDPLLSRIRAISKIPVPQRPGPPTGRLRRLLAPLLLRRQSAPNLGVSERPPPQTGRIKLSIED